MTDRFHLDHFIDAQEPLYEAALAEIRRGRKRTHWMWFFFPHLAELGTSEMANNMPSPHSTNPVPIWPTLLWVPGSENVQPLCRI